MRWLVIVVVAVVAAYFGYQYFSGQEGQDLAEQVEETAEQVVEETQEAAEQATDTAQEAAQEATDTAQEAAEEATDTAQEAAEEATDTAQEAAQSASDTVAALTVEGVNIGQEIGTMVSDTTSSLSGITDKASAEAALPSLEAVQTKLDDLSGTVSGLSEEGKEALASLLADGLPSLQELVTKVEGMEGVGEVVKPTLDAIMGKLDEWAKQPS